MSLLFSGIFMVVLVNYSTTLALVVTLLAALVAMAIFVYRGRYLPRTIMDVLDRLTDKLRLENAYAARARKLVTIDSAALAAKVKERVVGQDRVIDAIAAQLRRRLAGHRPGKPVAVFCLAGPPGVGKTLLAKVLAQELYGEGNHLHFFDMTQFGQPHSAASLFGQAKGYVGSTSYGSLTAALRDAPDAIVLLDEFEKAHPDVHKRFLTAWNDGFTTEASDGAKLSTAEAIFILTTNAASRRVGEIARELPEEPDEASRQIKKVLADAQFAPEVLSRIDAVFALTAMEGLDVARVVALEIEGLARQFGLSIADGGIDPEILLGAIETAQRRSEGGVRDIARAIELGVTDQMIEARSQGADTIRLFARGAAVAVEGIRVHTGPQVVKA